MGLEDYSKGSWRQNVGDRLQIQRNRWTEVVLPLIVIHEPVGNIAHVTCDGPGSLRRFVFQVGIENAVTVFCVERIGGDVRLLRSCEMYVSTEIKIAHRQRKSMCVIYDSRELWGKRQM